MAFISFKPSDYFNTKLYTGNGSTQTISGVGFQPDMTWIKDRDASEAQTLFDSTRGVTKRLYVNSDAAESTSAISLTAWNSDGFALGAGGEVNTNNDKFVSWNWKAGTTSGLSGGTITPSSYSYNVTTGFGIYKWSGTGSAGTIAHGLGKVPQMILLKRLDTTYSWFGYFDKLGSSKNLSINLTNAAGNAGAGIWNSTSATNTVFSVGNDDGVNLGSGTYVAYVWCNVAGSSSIGEYTGNGNASGTFIYTGFRPQFFIAKESNAVDPWHSWTGNVSTSGANNINKSIQPNDVSAEATDNNKDVDFLASGVKLRTSNSEINGSGSPYIYMAWAAEPIVGSGGTPGVAR